MEGSNGGDTEGLEGHNYILTLKIFFTGTTSPVMGLKRWFGS